MNDFRPRTVTDRTSRKFRNLTFVVVGLALGFPTLMTWVYFIWLRASPASAQQTAYLAGKLIQFGCPVLWILATRPSDLRWREMLGIDSHGQVRSDSKCQTLGIWLGLGFGMLVATAMWILYTVGLKPAGFFDGPGEQVREKVLGMGIRSPAWFAAVGVFYAACHSLLEEYYWRWFLFRELRRNWRLPTAVCVSSVGFMAHHLLVLANYFGWTSPATWLFSCGVAMGGAAWAWLLDRSQSLLGPWFSHCLVDAAIFWIGYDLVRDALH